MNFLMRTMQIYLMSMKLTFKEYHMNKVFVLVLMILFLSSCDPDVPGEDITLPTMEFGINVFPDTAYIKLGDTITIHSGISSTLSDGVKITDGKATIDLYMAYSPEMPITTISSYTAEEGTHFSFKLEKGDIRVNPTTNKLAEIYAIPYDDSILVMINFIPLKIGTYCFQVQSKFFEGSQGKTRTDPKFDMEDTHWDLWQVAEHPGPNPGEKEYYTSYWFAVYE